jgi:octaprenyl-diphosphate synthase
MAVATGLKQEQVVAAAASDNALERLHALLTEDLRQVNALIISRMESPVPLIPQLAGYLIASGGKRLRPLLTLAAARLFGYQGDAHLLIATAVEFIHTATLLHDDVVDESDLRRGRESANSVWGNQASVLVGDFLFSRSFELMVETHSLEVLRILSRASAVIAEGEVLQLITSNDTATVEADYLRVIEGKTAELFAAACEVGAVIAGCDKPACTAMRDYGMALGMAFQIVDDVLDYSAVQAQLGKTVGDDFRAGKITMPILIAFGRGTDEERSFWTRTLERQEQEESDLDHAIGLLRKHNALDGAMDRAREWGERAVAALEHAPEGVLKQALADVIAFCIERDY